ncbi:sensor histidine kinase [Bowmanella yangjiangensis]|uniref:histidine kinase n=1 Tax=Bowmanella yangjiangensis TaxID=2811230 RepID=A0ABS3CWX5_9ALTE|nr:HAMP domain-containing sensor histidine kinase [Bowmanella yangjiangensis]MBN7821629.1 HAMP domain-containing histidine kinase [Bowmanella yangjiangensis]
MKTRESRLMWLFCAMQFLVLVLLVTLTWQMDWSMLAILTLLFALLYPLAWVTFKFWQQVNLPLMQLSNYVQRLQNGEEAENPKQHRHHGLVDQLRADVEKLAAHSLKADHQQQSLALLIEMMFGNWSQPVCVFSGQGCLLYANPASNSLPGIARLVGSNYRDLGFEMTSRGLQHQLLHKGWQTQSIRYQWLGEQYWLFTAFDISQSLQQAELAIQTNMVRVLSHELRNSLTPMSSMADTLLCSQDWHEEQVRKVLSRIQQRADTLLDFVHRFAAVSQMPLPNPVWFSLAEVLEQCRSLLQEGDKLEISGDDRCYGDPQLIAQVLINLVKNALEASNTGDRRVSVRLFSQNKLQHLLVEDNGQGFANLENALTPLYTTKAAGSGIGLALVNVIISKHGGRLSLANSESGGARVELVWPLP